VSAGTVSGDSPRLLQNNPPVGADPAQEVIPDFGWSPSGKQLAVVRQRSSSDVVLIKDLQEKGKD